MKMEPQALACLRPRLANTGKAGKPQPGYARWRFSRGRAEKAALGFIRQAIWPHLGRSAEISRKEPGPLQRAETVGVSPAPRKASLDGNADIRALSVTITADHGRIPRWGPRLAHVTGARQTRLRVPAGEPVYRALVV